MWITGGSWMFDLTRSSKTSIPDTTMGMSIFRVNDFLVGFLQWQALLRAQKLLYRAQMLHPRHLLALLKQLQPPSRTWRRPMVTWQPVSHMSSWQLPVFAAAVAATLTWNRSFSPLCVPTLASWLTPLLNLLNLVPSLLVVPLMDLPDLPLQL